ncbi:MAG: hypothetical protein Q9183_004210 [Haloplaca sp. 2 TL-2023]
MNSLQRCLRPTASLSPSRHGAARAFYSRFYSVANAIEREEAHAKPTVRYLALPLQSRLQELFRSGTELYPRYPQDATVNTMDVKRFSARFDKIPFDKLPKSELALYGMWVSSILSQGFGSYRQEESNQYGSQDQDSPLSI